MSRKVPYDSANPKFWVSWHVGMLVMKKDIKVKEKRHFPNIKGKTSLFSISVREHSLLSRHMLRGNFSRNTEYVDE